MFFWLPDLVNTGLVTQSLQQTGLVKKKASNPQKEAGDEMQVAADMDEDIIFEKLLTPSMPLLSSMHKSQASQATFGSSQAV